MGRWKVGLARSTSHPSDDDLDRYAAGKMSPEEQEELREHFVTCEHCMEILLLGAPAKADEVSDTEFDELWRKYREAQLLERIRLDLPSELRERYQVLIGKRDSGSLDRKEHQELISLTDQLEHWQAERVEALADLVELRKIPLEELLEELNLAPLLDD